MRKLTRFQPRLENLEDRTVPAVSWNLNGSVLTVRSDDAGSNTTIEYQNDGTNTIHIVATSGQSNIDQTIDSTLVRTINFQGGNGKDTVRILANFEQATNETLTNGKSAVQVGSLVSDNSYNLNVSLAGGNDDLFLSMSDVAGTLNPAAINIRVLGGSGNDLIHTDLAVLINNGTNYNVSLEGNSGHDRILFHADDIFTEPSGRLNLGVYGQDGNDSIEITTNFGILNNNGTVYIRTDGGKGDDQILVDLVFRNGTNARTHLEVVARDGKDRVKTAVQHISANTNNWALVRANDHTLVGRSPTTVGVVGAKARNLSLFQGQFID